MFEQWDELWITSPAWLATHTALLPGAACQSVSADGGTSSPLFVQQIIHGLPPSSRARAISIVVNTGFAMFEQYGELWITSPAWLATHTALLPGEFCQFVSAGGGAVVVVSGGAVVVGGTVVVGGIVVVGGKVVVAIVVVGAVVVVSPCSYSCGVRPVLQPTNNSININPNTTEVTFTMLFFMPITPNFL